jgi:hypothetical protein
MPKLITVVQKITLKNVEMNNRRSLFLLISVVMALLIGESIFLFIDLPVSILRLNIIAIIWSMPLVLFIGLSIIGIKCLETFEKQWFVKGWLFALFCSFALSVITGNRTLFPDRHIEYLMIPMCITSAYGLKKVFKGRMAIFHIPQVSKKLKPAFTRLPLLVTVGLILSSAVAVYPGQRSLEGINETISKPCINAFEWMGENLEKNYSVMAADLRLCRLAWAKGFNSTFEETGELWLSEDWKKCRYDLECHGNRIRVSHVLIDDVMRNDIIELGLWRNLNMSNQSYDKFLEQPFELIYRNVTLNAVGQEEHWIEIFEVNWTYIEKYFYF